MQPATDSNNLAIMDRRGTIDWPNESEIITKNTRNATLDYIRNLFHNTGLIASLAYLALKIVLLPCLEQQYSQRTNISASTLLSLRRLVSRLQNCVRSTPVAVIGYNEGNNSVERCTQTPEDKVEPLESSWTVISERLKNSTTYLQQFVNSNSQELGNLNACSIEARLLSDRFKLESNMRLKADLSREMINSIREVKGWFVSGRIH